MRIILTQDGKDIMGSDGLMHIDGRLNMASVINEVHKRNDSYRKNFPHKIADGFYIWEPRSVIKGMIIKL